MSHGAVGSDGQHARRTATVVCLDCTTYEYGDNAVVTTYAAADHAQRYADAHATERGHRTVALPGWPGRGPAVRMARALVALGRIKSEHDGASVLADAPGTDSARGADDDQ